MKIKILSIFAILAIFFVQSCKGPEGPIGPVGPTGAIGTAGANGTTGTAGANGGNGKDGTAGATGATGATGAKGETGNANVVYSDWKTIDWTGGFGRYDANKRVYLIVKSTNEPLFTQDAMDKAVIYTYFKGTYKRFDQANNEYKLLDVISNASNGISFDIKKPGATTNTINDFSYIYCGAEPILGVNYFNPYLTFYTEMYDSVKSMYVADPVYSTKTAADFRDYVKGIQYRHIIVYGSTKGRMAAINWKDYEEVKRTLNLKN